MPFDFVILTFISESPGIVTIVALPRYTLLRISGADAAAFLHGQFTCDVLALQPGRSTYGGYCTPKGRLLATFLLCADNGGYTMMLPSPLAEPIRKRLSMYVLRSKVTIGAPSPHLSCVGIFGSDAVQQIAAQATRTYDVVTVGDHIIVHVPQERFLKFTPHPASDLEDGTESWNALDIAAGVAFITPATQEAFVPQMVNLDRIGALSYSKGCYPGQEIVARTHYLGRLKQRMYRASVAAPAVAGDRLYCAELGDQSGGMIVTAAPAAGGRHEVLAVLQVSTALSASWHLGSLQGAPLQLSQLPYSLD